MFGEEQMRCQKYSKDFPEARYEFPGSREQSFKVWSWVKTWNILKDSWRMAQSFSDSKLTCTFKFTINSVILEESTILHHTGKKFVIVVAASAALFMIMRNLLAHWLKNINKD